MTILGLLLLGVVFSRVLSGLLLFGGWCSVVVMDALKFDFQPPKRLSAGRGRGRPRLPRARRWKAACCLFPDVRPVVEDLAARSGRTVGGYIAASLEHSVRYRHVFDDAGFLKSEVGGG